MQQRCIQIPLNCCATACHSLSKLLIHKQYMDPHTHTHPQTPSLLDLLSHPRTPYSFPPSGNSFHVNTTSICGAALSLHTSIHRCAAYLSHLQGKQMMFISCLAAYITSTSLCAWIPARCTDSARFALRYSICPAEVTFSLFRFCHHVATAKNSYHRYFEA